MAGGEGCGWVTGVAGAAPAMLRGECAGAVCAITTATTTTKPRGGFVQSTHICIHTRDNDDDDDDNDNVRPDICR